MSSLGGCTLVGPCAAAMNGTCLGRPGTAPFSAMTPAIIATPATASPATASIQVRDRQLRRSRDRAGRRMKILEWRALRLVADLGVSLWDRAGDRIGGTRRTARAGWSMPRSTRPCPRARRGGLRGSVDKLCQFDERILPINLLRARGAQSPLEFVKIDLCGRSGPGNVHIILITTAGARLLRAMTRRSANAFPPGR